jgi:hypothetical protein
MSLQDLPAIAVERLEGGAWGVHVEDSAEARGALHGRRAGLRL